MRSRGGAPSAVVDHPDRSLKRRPGGGFEIAAGGQPTIRVVSTDGGWRIEETERPRGWFLRRADAHGAGFVLCGGDGRTEAGRTMPLVGTGREIGPRFLLLDDGRLFRIVLREPRQGRFELLGWETPGPYVNARPSADGWVLSPTVAAGGVDELTVIMVLLAAEILDAEDALQPEAT